MATIPPETAQSLVSLGFQLLERRGEKHIKQLCEERRREWFKNVFRKKFNDKDAKRTRMTQQLLVTWLQTKNTVERRALCVYIMYFQTGKTVR